MANVIDILNERGFIAQTTHDSDLREYLESAPATCYIGFDPTASSLHVGSLVPIMSLAHMQRHHHRPIALVGGGTGLVGDPSGKTEMRKFLTAQDVENNARGIQKQLSRFLDFSGDRAMMVNNADWLTQMEYIPFLRDIGRHFSVNRMIKAESYKMRLDSDEGLSFIEFNYMLLQAYDFMRLFDDHGCRLQMGGSDQWGNIVAGADLVRRIRQETVFGVTFPLVMTSAGEKMGKTAKGAVWLDPERTPPYDYYQFWINTHDKDVERFLALFTFLPMDEIREVSNLKDADLNAAKSALAFEATALAHGMDEAGRAFNAASDMFGARTLPKTILPSSRIPRARVSGDDDSTPRSAMTTDELREGAPAFMLFERLGLCQSRGAARRLISQGGGYINGERIRAFDYLITNKDLVDGKILLRSGKKKIHQIVVN
ncbi:Tyrosine--tRNA ligase [Candidatus Desulfarcum epimagneticum]|uniref:Tyrosine--tRNA ligase n=1 Tax=uncultured Desulfobacteraceae bacterium TaxID=218296 RepID=A0A484HE99_9BACT|nr:Tyrosine--tRNA ligase [uncultured Desulfobacteraceae bacterium]